MTKSKTSAKTFAKGGRGSDNKMFPAQASETAPKGRTADPTAKDNAPGKRFAKGGGRVTTGFGLANPAHPGRTSQPGKAR